MQATWALWCAAASLPLCCSMSAVCFWPASLAISSCAAKAVCTLARPAQPSTHARHLPGPDEQPELDREWPAPTADPAEEAGRCAPEPEQMAAPVPAPWAASAACGTGSSPDQCARDYNASRPHLLQHATQLVGQLTHGHLRCGRSRLGVILAGDHLTALLRSADQTAANRTDLACAACSGEPGFWAARASQVWCSQACV